VGPVWGSGDEDSKLTTAIYGALRIAGELGLVSIALPAISTGIFGFPKDRAAEITFNVIDDYYSSEVATTLDLIRLTLFDRQTLNIFLKVWDNRKE
jgi:O-acetyl-ADP-ribose deacetylase (regulator of RNase III)